MMPELHDDIWKLIFLAVVRERAELLATIRSVNVHWHNLASCTPLLWTNIVLDQVAHLTNFDYIELFLSKSGGALLDVTVFLPGYKPNNDIKVQLSLNSFKKAAWRIRTLHISLFDHIGVEFLLKCMGDGQPAPVLEIMEIFISVKNDDYDDNFSFEALTTCFIPSPNLQHLTIPSCPFPSPINAAPRISTITSMSVFNTFPSMMVENFLPSLEVAKHLERFYFYSKDTYSWDETARLDYSPIAHVESLRSIDVTAPGMGTDFMRNLEAPVLSHARLDGWRRHYNPKYDKLTFKGQMKAEPISAALQRTSIRSPLLRSLQLEFIRLYKPDEEFPNILTGNWFPNLEELLLKEVSVKDQHFIEAARSSTPLKQLAVFKCKHVSARGLRPFVVGRQHGFSLTIELRPKVSSKAFKALSALCNITVRR